MDSAHVSLVSLKINEGGFEEYRCALFDVELENDDTNHYYCIRCDKCKQAEVKEQ